MTRSPDVGADAAPPDSLAEPTPSVVLRGSIVGLASSFGASAWIQGLNLLTGVLIARELGPTGRGDLAAIILWPTLLAVVGMLGLPDAITYFAATKRLPRNGLLGTGITIAVGESAVLGVIGLAILGPVLRNYSHSTLSSAYLFLLFIPVNLATLVALSVLNGERRYVAYNLLRSTVIVATAAGLGIIALTHEFTLRNAVWVYLGANLLTMCLGFAAVARGLEGAPRVAFEVARPILRYGLRSHLSSVSNLLNAQLDQLVISAFLKPKEFGFYSVATTATSLTILVGTSVSVVALPVLASARSPEERLTYGRGLVSATLILATLATLPVFFATPFLLTSIFGTSFQGAAGVTRILLIAALPFAFGRTLGSILKGLNRPLDAGVAELVALGVTLAALAVLLPRLGIMGAAIASLLAYSTSAAWMTWRLSSALSVPAHRVWLPTRAEAASLLPLLRRIVAAARAT
jgi:O-antigen/teichoic acid export membrane protein